MSVAYSRGVEVETDGEDRGQVHTESGAYSSDGCLHCPPFPENRPPIPPPTCPFHFLRLASPSVAIRCPPRGLISRSNRPPSPRSFLVTGFPRFPRRIPGCRPSATPTSFIPRAHPRATVTRHRFLGFSSLLRSHAIANRHLIFPMNGECPAIQVSRRRVGGRLRFRRRSG